LTLHNVRRGMGRAVMVSLLSVLAACSSLQKQDTESAQKAIREKVDARVTAADEALKQGQQQQAIEQLDQAIKIDPSAKQPWLRKAQIHFESRQYGHAINDAQEVLQRDVSDLTAQSILAVSGLRVSADALAQLRKVNEVKGSTRSEAESVAKLIREALGEPILVAPSAEVAPAPVKPVRRAVRRAAPAPATTATPAAVPAPAKATEAVAKESTPTPAKAAPAPVAKPAPVVKLAPTTKPVANTAGRANPFGALQ
jgi:tetratricopeptide (TPR) repeat protein